jgi:hypothetical protein
MKHCIDCAFVHKAKYPFPRYLCGAPCLTDKVTGKPVIPCSNSRTFDYLCGPEGKYFQPKPEPAQWHPEPNSFDDSPLPKVMEILRSPHGKAQKNP